MDRESLAEKGFSQEYIGQAFIKNNIASE